MLSVLMVAREIQVSRNIEYIYEMKCTFCCVDHKQKQTAHIAACDYTDLSQPSK